MQIIAELTIPILSPSDPFAPGLVEVMEREMDIMERMFGKVTDPWDSSDQPEWAKEISADANDLVGTIFTRDKPFLWVEAGTSGGRVTFSQDYRPRTRKGVLGSRAKKGRVVAKGRGSPRNTAARDFRFLVAERRQRNFTKAMDKSILRSANKFFRGTRVEIVTL